MAHANLHDFDSACRRIRLHANPPVPGRKNPEPDEPAPPVRDDDDTSPPNDDEVEHHRPGRDERLVLRARPMAAGAEMRSRTRSAG